MRKKERNVIFVEKNNNIENFPIRRKLYTFTRYSHCSNLLRKIFKIHSTKSYLISSFGGKNEN